MLYGADDRLVMRNSHFLDIYPALKDYRRPGRQISTRCCARRSPTAAPMIRCRIWNRPPSSGCGWSGIGSHATCFEWQLSDNRWVFVNEARTRDGGTVVLYTDITELKRREREIQFLADHDTLTGLLQPGRVPAPRRRGASSTASEQRHDRRNHVPRSRPFQECERFRSVMRRG